MKAVFVDPTTDKVWTAGNIIKRIKLAETFEIVAKEGADALYDGSLTDGFIQDIKDCDGIITKEDLKNYQVRWEEPVTTDLSDEYKLYTAPLPSSGVVLVFMLNILKNFLPDRSPQSYHRIVESFKYGYAQRTHLGDMRFVPYIEPRVKNLTDPNFADYIRSNIVDYRTFTEFEHYGTNGSNREEHGTAHVSVIAPNGDAIAVTSTINDM